MHSKRFYGNPQLQLNCNFFNNAIRFSAKCNIKIYQNKLVNFELVEGN